MSGTSVAGGREDLCRAHGRETVDARPSLPAPGRAPVPQHRGLGRLSSWIASCFRSQWGERPAMTRCQQRAFALAAVIVAGGCDEPADEMDEAAIAFEQTAPVIAERSVQALGSSDGLARLAILFRARNIDELDMPQDQIVPTVVQESLDRIPDCLDIETDMTSYIEVDGVDACLHLDLEVRGSIRGEASLVTEPCGVTDCAVAVHWRFQAEGLQIIHKDNQWFESTFDGVVDLLAPLDDEADLQWTSDRSLSLDLGIGTYSVQSEAAWSIETGQCLQLDYDAELALLELDESFDPELQEHVDDIFLSAHGIRRCGSACPTAGSVVLSYGGGQLLRWSYAPDGRAEVEIEAPGGNSLLYELPCGG